MSIKQKSLKTTNAYRLRRIEEYLISRGYVHTNSHDSKLYQRWVDCVSNGRDICFLLENVTKDPGGFDVDIELKRIGGYGKDGYFKLDDPGEPDSADAYTVEDAVKRSRTALPQGVTRWT